MEQELRRREQQEHLQKQKSLTTSMVEGTILQQKLELGIGQLTGGEMYVGADDDYDKLLEQN